MSSSIKKILAVDYGLARTGLAHNIGDMAFGIGNITPKGKHECAKLIAQTAVEKGCELIVIGLPVNIDGTTGEKCEGVKLLGQFIGEYTDIPIDYQDERLTTVEAHGYLNITNTRGKKRKNVVDTLSAEIILQDYINSHK